METVKSIQQNTVKPILEPKRFVLWLFIVSSIMAFGSFTSAYIVRQGQGNWFQISLPIPFLINCFTAIAGSAAMIWSYKLAKKDEIDRLKIALGITFLISLVFIAIQIIGWNDLVKEGIYFSTIGSDETQPSKISGSFLYVISGLHLLHIVVASFYLLIIWVKSLQLKVHKMNLLGISMCATFYHFTGIMWIYLYLFFKLYQ